jgi:predicted O-methyltransferase YrrM
MWKGVVPTQSENASLNTLDNSYKKISEMTQQEREYLNTLILRSKPKKLLEIGVSAGGSSIVMLNAIKDIHISKLYSIDYLDYWYRTFERYHKNHKTGYFVDNYPDLKEKWKLYTGGLSLKFIHEIGNEIDFCLIDTLHVNPGEILDFLMVLPYLSENCIVVFHDVNLRTNKGKNCNDWAITTNLLMSAIYGKKYVQGNFRQDAQSEGRNECQFPNISAIKICKETRERVYEIFNLLTIKWQYLPSDIEEEEIIKHFGKFYDENYVKYLKSVFTYQRKYFSPLARNLKDACKIVLRNVLGDKSIAGMRKLLSKISILRSSKFFVK